MQSLSIRRLFLAIFLVNLALMKFIDGARAQGGFQSVDSLEESKGESQESDEAKGENKNSTDGKGDAKAEVNKEDEGKKEADGGTQKKSSFASGSQHTGEILAIRKIQRTEVFFRNSKESFFIPSGLKHNSFLKLLESKEKSHQAVTVQFNDKTREIQDVKEPSVKRPTATPGASSATAGASSESASGKSSGGR